MERNDVIKALEWCSELRLCVDCPMRAEGYFSHSVNDCKKALAEKAIALIRELTEENEAQDKAIINALKQIAKVREETKADTVRQFVERLKATPRRIREEYYPLCDQPPIVKMCLFLDDADIDQIAQELLGGEHK